MNFRQVLMGLAVVGTAMVSCSKNGLLTVSPEAIVLDGEGNGQYVTVKTSGEWSAVSNADWVILGMKEGVGESQVLVSALPAAESRSTVLVFSSSEGSSQVAVTQNAPGGGNPGGNPGGGSTPGGDTPGGGTPGGDVPTGVNAVDVIDFSFIGISGSKYLDWSKQGSSSAAVYAGNTAATFDSVQMRTKSEDSGIVTTTSGGLVTKVTVDWNANNSDTPSPRVLQVYGKNSAYSSPADLYDSAKQGVLLGSMTRSATTELTISGSYGYIGLRPAENALYLDKISIQYGQGGSLPGGGQGGDTPGGGETPSEGAQKVVWNVANYIAENHITVSESSNIVPYREIKVGSDVTFSVTAAENNQSGTFWGSEYRLYQSNGNCEFEIAVSGGKKLKTAKFSFTVKNGGSLLMGATTVVSGEAVSLGGKSTASFTLGNTQEKQNGQVKLTEIEVSYE